jgi:hypothetical protein
MREVCRSAHRAPGWIAFTTNPTRENTANSPKSGASESADRRRSDGVVLAVAPARKAVPVAQRIIEMLVGRLITDEEFRSQFLRDPENTLLGLCDRGLELSRTEIAALVNTDPTVWGRTADAIDPRLQKASFTNEAGMS